VREASQLYRERLDLLAEAESCGFDIYYHLAEHTARRWAWCRRPACSLPPRPCVTTGIRLYPLVYVLPLFHPAELAEEIAVFDQLSEGRLRDRVTEAMEVFYQFTAV